MLYVETCLERGGRGVLHGQFFSHSTHFHGILKLGKLLKEQFCKDWDDLKGQYVDSLGF